MANLFFDVLPTEIRQEIYGIRLSDALMRNYYRRIAQKVTLAQLVLKIQAQGLRITYHDIGYNSYNPENNMVRYVMEKCSKVITSYDDMDWWISNLITPVQRGLVIYYNFAQSSSHLHHPVNQNFVRTEYACNRLINILWMA